MPDFQIVLHGQVEPEEIERLRASVGWERTGGTYAEVLQRHFATYTVRDDTGELIGYVSVLSDGIADAFLLDLMVHPRHQKCGLGTRLVKRAVADMRAAGVQCVQVTFDANLTHFYAQCGFHIFGGGVIDFKHMQWNDK
ncbi:MAG: N-acetyltransferase [Anaerolineales bacterium]|nr:MAG: N-acetyltransferase [Anaerolineales bacterium]